MEKHIAKRRGFSSVDARNTRRKGHDDALAFANVIGMPRDYLNDHVAKKDVIDLSGDAHSVKSGEKKWQVFLYGLNRFESDHGFVALNGIGALLADCVRSFPESFDAYQMDRSSAKRRCMVPMRALCEKLQDRGRLKAFISKSMFNGGEVAYLTVRHEGCFHVFWNGDVIDCFGDGFSVCNSKARCVGQFDDQKVVFRYGGLNLAELEMRNDSRTHYREVRFTMYKRRVMAMLFATILARRGYSEEVTLYGAAIKKFHRRTSR